MPAAKFWAKRWPEARRCSTPHDWIEPRTGGMDSANRDRAAEIGRCPAAAGLQTASLDEVLCITAA
jgi:hypothetical protein